MKTTIQRALRIAACALIFGAAAAANAEQFSVQLDTNTLSGKGWLDLQFNPGPNTTPAASVLLSGFSGALDGAAEVSGAVGGALPGTVSFTNSTPYNDLFQPVILGGLFGFVLDFDGSFLEDGYDSGSVFAVSLYGADGMTALGKPDPVSNALLSISLLPASLGGIAVNVSDASLASAGVGNGAPVPEPATMLLLLAGGVALAATVGGKRVGMFKTR